MKVSDLILKLKRFDGDLEVVCCTEDEDLQAKGQVFRLMDLIDATVVEGEPMRGPDGSPTLKLGKSHISVKQVLLEVTADF